jgi:hypothetical protein
MAGLTFLRPLRAWTRTAIAAISLTLLSYGIPAGVPQAAAMPRSDIPALVWHGGPVQHHPRLYLLFWGPSWQTDPAHAALKGQMEALFGSLAGGQYNNLLTQYRDSRSDPEAYVHNDVRVGGEWLDPAAPPGPTAITSRLVAQEVETALTANPCHAGRGSRASWCPSSDAQVMVFPQQGTRYGGDLLGECGMHSSNLYRLFPPPVPIFFSQVRYPDGYPDGLCPYPLATAIHEYAETATDPEEGTDPAWTTDAGWFGTASEIADLCQQQEPQRYTTVAGNLGVQTFSVAPLWDNASHACALARGQEFWSPSTGKHTIEGAILAAYQASDPTGRGGPGGRLGYPVDEEQVRADGRQVDFQQGAITYSIATGQTATLFSDGVPAGCVGLARPSHRIC